MRTETLPAQLIVKARIIIGEDDSNPQDDICTGHQAGYYQHGQWRDVRYAQESELRAWLAEQGYTQVERSPSRYLIDGVWQRESVQ